MPIYPRKESKYFWCKFTVNGRTVRASTGETVESKARRVERKLFALAEQEAQRIKEGRYLWQEATERWTNETQSKAAKSIKSDNRHIKWLNQFLNDKPLDEIGRTDVDRIIKAKKDEGVSNATTNRMIAVLRGILRKAKNEWDWIGSYPHIRTLPEPKGRVRWITREDADRLIRELPIHLKYMTRFALATGLRERNITRLRWEWVDLENKVTHFPAEVMKNKKPLTIPLNNEAVSVLRDQIGKHNKYVFTYNGCSIQRANGKAWRRALVRAGIENFRFHDLRHTWASWHVQAETEIHELKELGGWSDISMVLRYAHLNMKHLARVASNIDRKEAQRPALRIV